ncbi:MAG: alpha-xylosidase [Prevotellaceae bacterium]|jgi:alpha-D-xyloside xylohydrolase|nr:alpha-xylosidase [Prevotellaceae bacterium]
MKPTNYHLFDFLDFDQKMDGSEVLWRAIAPTDAVEKNGDVIFTVPFQKQINSNEIAPDRGVAPKNYNLRIRAYGDKIVRTTIAFDVPEMDDSPILEMSPELRQSPLKVEKTKDAWIVKDSKGTIRTSLNLKEIETDWWSDLQPAPEPTLDLTFFPNGKKGIKMSAYDQFAPDRHDGMTLALVEKDGKSDRATMSFHAEPDENFVGTGERFAKMDLSGRSFYLKNQDGQGVNNQRTYKNVPLYLSSRLYGVFLHTSAYAKFSLAQHSTRSSQIMVEYPLLDVFLIADDSIEKILYGYRQLTGFPSLPPLWSFGTWMSRMSYFSADEINTICDRLRKEGYPCDVIHIDTGWFRTDWLCEWKFNEERFPNPPQFISDLRKNGYKVSLWQLPYIATEAEQLEEAEKNNYMCQVNGEKIKGGSNFSVQDYAGTIDFTYPKAVEWYKGLLKNLLDMGAVCIKTDFGENIHMDAKYHALEPKLLNNLYSLLYQKAAYEITKEITGDGIIWARAGWAGCQRYPLHWGGDSACSWDGMAGSLKGGLHLGLSGFGFWSHDVPGFHGVPNFMNSVIADDIYVRWTQLGVFSSHLRYHGTSKREPYEFPNIASTVKQWWKLRYGLIPYIYEQSKKVTESGYPILRALTFHHPDDHMCWHIDDQYYFGDDMMVAPVMNSKNKRDIYLPKGKWVNFFTGKVYEGEQWLKDEQIPLEQMPVFVKYGASIPMYFEHVDSTDDMDLSKTQAITFDDKYKSVFNKFA